MFIQVRDSKGGERFIDEEQLESGIAAGEIAAFRRSDGWKYVPSDPGRISSDPPDNLYSGQERRRSRLSRKIKSSETDSI